MQSNSKNGRDSSGELLRIIAMLLIVISHYSTHGVIDIYAGSSTMDMSLLYLQLLSMGGNIGLNLFIMVSGYYLYSSSFKAKKVISLISHVTVYSLICFLLLGGPYKSTIGLIQSAFPVIYNQYWFITGYVGVYLFFPYINILIKQIDKQGYHKLLLVMFATMSVIPFLFNTNFILSDFMWFVFMYCVGAYLRIYDLPQIIKKNKHLILIAVFAFLCGLVIMLHCMGDLIPLCRSHATYFNAKESPLILILVVTLFATVMGLEIKLKWINIIGGYTMGVYLFHENPYVRNILWNYVNNEQYHSFVFSLIINSIVVTVVVFMIGIIIDAIISPLNNLLFELCASIKEIFLNARRKKI